MTGSVLSFSGCTRGSRGEWSWCLNVFPHCLLLAVLVAWWEHFVPALMHCSAVASVYDRALHGQRADDTALKSPKKMVAGGIRFSFFGGTSHIYWQTWPSVKTKFISICTAIYRVFHFKCNRPLFIKPWKLRTNKVCCVHFYPAEMKSI